MSLLLDKWMQHRVYEWNSDLFVRKEQRKSNNYSPQEVQSALDFVKEKFWEFCPKTKIVSNEESYVIIQKRIDGKTLQDFDISLLSEDTLISLQKILKIYEDILLDGFNFDIMWMQKNAPEWWRIYDDDFLAQHNIFIRKYYVVINIFNYIYHCLRRFNQDIFESSNLMLDIESNVFLVDNVFIEKDPQTWIEKSITFMRHAWRYGWLKKNQIMLSQKIKKTP